MLFRTSSPSQKLKSQLRVITHVASGAFSYHRSRPSHAGIHQFISNLDAEVLASIGSDWRPGEGPILSSEPGNCSAPPEAIRADRCVVDDQLVVLVDDRWSDFGDDIDIRCWTELTTTRRCSGDQRCCKCQCSGARKSRSHDWGQEVAGWRDGDGWSEGWQGSQIRPQQSRYICTSSASEMAHPRMRALQHCLSNFAIEELIKDRKRVRTKAWIVRAD